MELLCCKCVVDSGNGTDWATLISSVGAVAVGVIALIYANAQTKKTLNSKKEEELRAEIHKKLNEFYGPLYQLRKKSNIIYEKFRAKFTNEHPNFSTLTYLLNGNTIDGNDAILLNEIIKIGEECETLIHSKAGMIDDENLRKRIIPRATTHFLILRLAYKGVLKGEAEKFKDLTFPRELDELLEKRKLELEKQLEELNKKE